MSLRLFSMLKYVTEIQSPFSSFISVIFHLIFSPRYNGLFVIIHCKHTIALVFLSSHFPQWDILPSSMVLAEKLFLISRVHSHRVYLLTVLFCSTAHSSTSLTVNLVLPFFALSNGMYINEHTKFLQNATFCTWRIK